MDENQSVEFDLCDPQKSGLSRPGLEFRISRSSLHMTSLAPKIGISLLRSYKKDQNMHLKVRFATARCASHVPLITHLKVRFATARCASHVPLNPRSEFHIGCCSTSNPSFLPRPTFVSHLAKYLPSNRGPKSFFSTSDATSSFEFQRSVIHKVCGLQWWQPIRYRSNALVTVDTADSVARFCLDIPSEKNRIQPKGVKKTKKKMSRKAKLNQLKWYRLKAKKKMKSTNPEVRIRYKLDKAKRKEEWLIEKLRKLEMPKAPEPEHDPEILTEEERFYLKRTGQKKKNYVPVGRRGVFGGVVLNMHLHWKKHETVNVICKPCRPGQVYEYAKELTRLSKGTVIDIKADDTILFYRGKNYVQPEVMSPPDTLSKQKALEKFKFEQSLEHTGQFIEKLEKELEDYHKHIALFRKS